MHLKYESKIKGGESGGVNLRLFCLPSICLLQALYIQQIRLHCKIAGEFHPGLVESVVV